MSAYRPYPKTKPSGVEWLGDVPEEWTVSKLKHVVDPGRSITYGIVQAGPDIPGGIPYIRPADMGDECGVIDPDGIMRTSTEIAASYTRSAIRTGDLVCSIGPSFGKVMVIPEWLDGGNLTQGTARVAISRFAHARFYFWVLLSEESYGQWESSIGGATFRALNLGPLAETYISLPPLPEQIQIASFLDRECGKLDALQAKQERLIELLKEKRQALISHAVTRGLDPTAKLKPSGIEWLGDVPEHWEIQPLSYVCRFQSGKAHEPFIDDDGEFVCVNSRFVSTEGESRKFCSRNLSPAKPRDVLMVMSDLPNGRALAKAYFVGENEKLAVNQRVCILTAYSSYSKFLYYYLDRNQGFLRHDDGVSQTHLSNSDFTKLKLPVPPIQEQHAIVAHLDEKCGKIDQLKAKAERGIELLKERRSALISAAVTGKIDVRNHS